MKSKQNWDIPFTNNSTNNTIRVFSNLLNQQHQKLTNNTPTHPRVSEVEVQSPRVDNNNNNNNNNNDNDVQHQRLNNNTTNDVRPPRLLRPRAKVYQQKYSKGKRVYRIFREPHRLIERQRYIYDF